MKQGPEIFLFTCNGVVVDIVKSALRLKSGDTGIMYLGRIVLDPSILPIGKKHNRQHFKFDIILGPYINQDTRFCPQVGNYMSKMSFVHFPAFLEKKCELATAAVDKFYKPDKNVQDFGIAPNKLGRLLQGQPSCMLVPCNVGCPVEIKSWRVLTTELAAPKWHQFLSDICRRYADTLRMLPYRYEKEVLPNAMPYTEAEDRVANTFMNGGKIALVTLPQVLKRSKIGLTEKELY